MLRVTTSAEEGATERRFRNHIRQFWHYLSDAEFSGNEKTRDEYFLSMKHGLQRSQARLILSDMKRKSLYLNSKTGISQ